jgi:lipoate-protein ligase A
MRLLDLTLPSAGANLALDEALLLEAEDGRGGEVLRLWEWPAPAVVLGSGGVLADDVDEPACAADGVPILRRASGGGTVLLARGCLCFSLVLAYARSPLLGEIRSSYAFILSTLADVLADLVPGAAPAGISDLAAGGRKFSGNAQQRKRRHLLHHGTLLYDFDLALLARYLRPPPRQPEYRRGRDHAAFVMNLPCSADELRRRLRRAWGAGEESSAWPEETVRRLVAEKYARSDWTRRR